MRRYLPIFVIMAALVAAGMYPVSLCSWFAQTFSQLADGTAFTGQGAVGGTWDTFPSGLATVATSSGRKCVKLNTRDALVDSIRFAATNSLSDIVRVDFTISTDALSIPPVLKSTARAGLCLFRSDSIGVRAFGGYTAAGWKTLYAHGFDTCSNAWLDCRAEFDYSTAGKAYVTYCANSGSGDWVPLADATGTTSFEISTASRVRAITFDGNGGVGEFSGFAVAKNSDAVIGWTGDASGDWDDKSSWNNGKGPVPGDGDMAVIGNNRTITYDVEGGACVLETTAAEQKVMPVGDDGLHIGSGSVRLTRNGDSAPWSCVTADPGVALELAGTFAGVELGYGCTLTIDRDAGDLLITDAPFYLDHVKLNILPKDALPDSEALALLTAPYGSGGVPASLLKNGKALSGWTTAWHGNLDGSSTLWLVQDSVPYETALWLSGVWGNLVNVSNWGEVKPSSDHAAWIGLGNTKVDGSDAFDFAYRFDIGGGTNEAGEVSMSGGTVSGAGAIRVGAQAGSGTLDVVGGTVIGRDYLWNRALTIGAGTNASGVVKVGVDSKISSRVQIEDGGISVGEGGAATLEVGRGDRIIGEVSADGAIGVGYAGELIVSGGRLTGNGSFYVGRSAREEVYDVSMTVSGGSVSNLVSGAFWIGSYGGIGSKAMMSLLGGEVYVTNRFVCGGYRSAAVVVDGGTLVAPEICVGHGLLDDNDYASFTLASGRVETAGFTSGATGSRQVTLTGGELVATAANDDFFAGLDDVRLEGAPIFENVRDVTITSTLMGPGGLTKTGAGTCTLAGHAAWVDTTRVAQGVLDLDGGMIMGSLEVADDAKILHAKYDDIDLLPFTEGTPWEGDGTASVDPYLRVRATLVNQVGNALAIAGSDGVTKAALKVIATDAGAKALSGWTPFGWVSLGLAEGSALSEASCAVEILLDFSRDSEGYGKPYVIYKVRCAGAADYERLESADGLTVFPVAGEASALTAVLTGAEKTESSLGLGLAVSDTTSRWIGGDGAWEEASNWSGGVCPADGVMAFVEKPVTISLGGTCRAKGLVANAAVVLTGGTLSLSDQVAGVGKLTLAGANLVGGLTMVNVPLEIEAGTANTLGASAQAVTLPKSVKGAGALTAAACFYGDTRGYTGNLTLVDGFIGSDAAAQNGDSSWTINGFPFGISGIDYTFGALNGTITAAEDDADIRLIVGALDEDGALAGSWRAGGGRSGLEWTAAAATLTYAVRNASYLVLRGGGRVVLGSADGVPEALTFTDAGGAIAFASGIDADLSGVFVDSTAPIVFDDTGVDRVWAQTLSASNVGGFVKRGSGTLTWLKSPAYAMNVTVEAGRLVVPFGTRLGFVSLASDAQIVVDFTGAAQDGIAFSATGANVPLDASRLVFVNVPEKYDYNTVHGANNGLVVANNAHDFVWSGAAGDAKWSTPENWLIDEVVATRAPQTNDTVSFLRASCTTLLLDRVVCVMKLSSMSSLHLSGGGLETLLSFDMPHGDVEMANAAVSCGSEFDVRSISGTGSLTLGSGVLTVSPQADHTDVFAGTLHFVTNFVKRGKGTFRYEPDGVFTHALDVQRGTLVLACGETNLTAVAVTMKAGQDPDTILDLNGDTLRVASFTGSGTVQNGLLITADAQVVQSGGRLVIPMAANTTYYASHADEKLELTTDEDTDLGVAVTIVVPRSWFVAGASGRHAVFCESANIHWDIQREGSVQKSDGDGWWSIPGGGFSVRLR